MKRIILVSIMSVVSIAAFCGDFDLYIENVQHTDVAKYKVQEVQKITFKDGIMTVTKKDGSTDNTEIAEIARLHFANPTDISNISTDSKTMKAYDLTGRKVDNPTNGLYIINGKKVYVNHK